MICHPSRVGELFRRARPISTVLMDVDGVLTNEPIIYDTDHREIKIYNAHDGLGITLARLAGLKTGILSARESEAIRHRAAELQMDFLILGRFDKQDALGEFLKENSIPLEKICFIGDDLPDIPVMEQVGLPVAVQNAAEEVKQLAGFITRREGGRGAVREVVEFILHAQGRLEETQKKVFARNKKRKLTNG